MLPGYMRILLKVKGNSDTVKNNLFNELRITFFTLQPTVCTYTTQILVKLLPTIQQVLVKILITEQSTSLTLFYLLHMSAYVKSNNNSNLRNKIKSAYMRRYLLFLQNSLCLIQVTIQTNTVNSPITL